MIKLVACSRTKFGETYQVLCLKHEDYNDPIDDIDDLEDPIEILFIGNDVYEIPWIDRETLVTSHAGWRLASALYGYREMGTIEDVPEVELPDGTVFVIDEEIE
jgi:hypothetical protein